MKATLTAAEVSELLGVAQSTVHQKAREGSLPSIKVGDRTLFPARAIKHLADYGNLPVDAEIDPESTTAKVMLTLERKTCAARISAIDEILAELDDTPKLQKIRSRNRSVGTT